MKKENPLLKKIKHSIGIAEDELIQKLNLDPDVGQKDFVTHCLRAMNVDVDTQHPEKIIENLPKLSREQRKMLLQAMDEHEARYKKIRRQLDKKVHSFLGYYFKATCKILMDTIIKGGTIGLSVAGFINSFFPSAGPVLVSSLAEHFSLPYVGKIVSKAGAAMISPELYQKALSAVAAVGVASGFTITEGGKATLRGIVKGTRKLKEIASKLIKSKKTQQSLER